MFAGMLKFFRDKLAGYDHWLAINGLDKPCRSCIPQEHDKTVHEKAVHEKTDHETIGQ
ncbi:hypothetical protein ACVFI8_14735 [Agarivorans sp. MS3-6]